MKRAVLWAMGMVVIGSAVGVVAAKKTLITSQWRDRELTIDGDSGDWPGPLRPIEENHPLMAAAMNDGEYLYLVISTSDSTERRQILRQGLVVWFDPSGSEKKHFGLKYPVGIPPEERPTHGGGGGGGGGYRRGPGGGGRQPSDPGSRDPSSSGSSDQVEPTNRLEVYGPQKDDAHSFVTEMAPGITVKTGQAEGFLVYELKVPLAKTTAAPYAIETKPGALIGFGIETPKVEHASGEGRGGGMGGLGGFGGGMGGRGGGGGGGGMGRGGGQHGQYEQPKPLKSWVTIQLANSVPSSQLPASSSK
jgi:hypothetical protein